MAIISDVIMTTFAVRGLSSLVGAMKQVSSATTDMAKAQRNYNIVAAMGLPATSALMTKAQKNLQMAGMAAVQANLLVASSAGVAFAGIVAGVEKAIQAYSDFGKEIMNIRDLTGASAAQSVQAAVLMKAAGMSDMQEIRDIMRLSSATFSPQGRSALGRLGISANPNAQGIDLFNSIAEGYQRSNLPQMMKTKILEDIFGMRGAAALMPLLRITKEEREEISAVAAAFDTKGLAAIQRFQVSSALLGITLQQQIIFPLAQAFMPVMKEVVGVLGFAATAMGNLNRLFGGVPAHAAAFAVLAGAIGLGVVAITRMWAAMKAMLVTLRATAAVQAFITALQGPGGVLKVAAAVGVAGLGIYGLSKLGETGGGGGGMNVPANKMNTAADKMLAAAGMMQDQFSRYTGKGVPRGLQEFDIGQISRQQALGAIG